MISISAYTFNPFQENTFILYDETKECVIIDAGCYTSSEKQELKGFIEQNNLKPKKLLNTHCHIDHVLGNAFIYEQYKLKTYMHKVDTPTLEMAPLSGKMWDIGLEDVPSPEGYIDEGDSIKFGNSTLEILFTPGHSVGHIVFVNHEQKFIIGGDVLFKQSIGRTDLPGGNHEQLINSIKTKLFTLPDDYIVYPGHGPETTIGYEKSHNPFLL